MLRRCLGLLLIGMWTLQGAIPPHTHPGLGGSQLLAHAQLRHFHWGFAGCGHHGSRPDASHAHPHSHPHPHSTPPADGEAPADHDHDAVYILDCSLVADFAPAPEMPDAPGSVAAIAEWRPDHAGDLVLAASDRYGGPPIVPLATVKLLI